MTDEITKNEKTGFDLACYVMTKTVGKVPLAGDIISFGCSRVTARWKYMEVQPLLILSINRNSLDDPITKHLIDEIVETASFGAQRNNFVNYYVKRKNLLNLPKDPSDIMYGHW